MCPVTALFAARVTWTSKATSSWNGRNTCSQPSTREKNIKIGRLSDHGHAIGIYIRDPDGNGIELSYETPREE